MMNSTVLLLGLVAATMSIVAFAALYLARRANSYCLDLEILVIDADQKIADLENQVFNLIKEAEQLVGQFHLLAADSGRQESQTGHAGFSEAIALIQHGANIEQLISTCGISRAEAQLVETLYGQNNLSAAGNSANKITESVNKFVLVDSQLEVADKKLNLQ